MFDHDLHFGIIGHRQGGRRRALLDQPHRPIRPLTPKAPHPRLKRAMGMHDDRVEQQRLARKPRPAPNLGQAGMGMGAHLQCQRAQSRQNVPKAVLPLQPQPQRQGGNQTPHSPVKPRHQPATGVHQAKAHLFLPRPARQNHGPSRLNRVQGRCPHSPNPVPKGHRLGQRQRCRLYSHTTREITAQPGQGCRVRPIGKHPGKKRLSRCLVGLAHLGRKLSKTLSLIGRQQLPAQKDPQLFEHNRHRRPVDQRMMNGPDYDRP